MALDFNASNRKLVVNSAAPLESLTEFSVLVWVRLSATPAKDDGIFVREKSGSGIVYRLILDDASGNMQFALDRASGFGFKTSSSLGLAIDTWKCVAVTFSESDNLNMYIGDLSSILEAPTFSSDSAGSGALDATDGPLDIGNGDAVQTSRFFTGSIAVVKHFDKRLNLQQLIAEQFSNVNTADRNYYAELGQTGITTQADWSRYANNGAITGAIQSPHVPLESPFGADVYMPSAIVAPSGRIMGSLAGMGGLAGAGGLAGRSGGMAG